jgi:uridine phosphorylase
MGTDNVEILLSELDALVNIDFATRQVKKEKTTLEIVRVGTSGAIKEDVLLDVELCSVAALGLDTLVHFYGLEQKESEMVLINEVMGLLNFWPYFAKSDQELLARIGYDMLPGYTVTCPGFYGPQGRIVRLTPKIDDIITKLGSILIDGAHNFTNLEMETSGYYALGILLGHKVLSVNAIVAQRITNQFSKNAEAVIDRLAKKVLERI